MTSAVKMETVFCSEMLAFGSPHGVTTIMTNIDNKDLRAETAK